MKVLVACEESQVVCTALRKLGHEAYSCDVLFPSGDHYEWHIRADVSPLLNGNCKFETMDGEQHEIVGTWDMIIGFPPCTYLSNAGSRQLYPTAGHIDEERYKKGLKAKEFFLSILNADCPRIAVENPVSSKVFEMPEFTQQFEPYWFGVPYKKHTRLWLKGLPPLEPTNMVKPISTFCPSNTSKTSGNKGAAKRGHDARNRSKTFKEVGEAMAVQWTAEKEKTYEN